MNNCTAAILAKRGWLGYEPGSKNLATTLALNLRHSTQIRRVIQCFIHADIIGESCERGPAVGTAGNTPHQLRSHLLQRGEERLFPPHLQQRTYARQESNGTSNLRSKSVTQVTTVRQRTPSPASLTLLSPRSCFQQRVHEGMLSKLEATTALSRTRSAALLHIRVPAAFCVLRTAHKAHPPVYHWPAAKLCPGSQEACQRAAPDSVPPCSGSNETAPPESAEHQEALPLLRLPPPTLPRAHQARRRSSSPLHPPQRSPSPPPQAHLVQTRGGGGTPARARNACPTRWGDPLGSVRQDPSQAKHRPSRVQGSVGHGRF
jgi:hypothetical protein